MFSTYPVLLDVQTFVRSFADALGVVDISDNSVWLLSVIAGAIAAILVASAVRECFFLPLRRRFNADRLKQKPSWKCPDTGLVTIPDKRTTAIVFINSKSGGQLGGAEMVQLFKKYLHRAQVFDLANTNPKEVLEPYKHNHVNRVRILCCGGDGTVGWILGVCRDLNAHFPVGVFPLGTGNDLARSINWGSGMNFLRPYDVQRYLSALSGSKVLKFDQWRVEVHGPRSLSGESLDRVEAEAALEVSNPSFASQAVKVFTMNNYFSMGVDGDIALNFHNERIRHPERFTSQRMNVIKYAVMGFEGAFEGVPLGSGLHVETSRAPGEAAKDLPINPLWKGIIVGNVPFYQGGKTFWDPDRAARNTHGFTACSLSDQLLEVMAVSGTLHIGMVHLQVDKAIPLSQSNSVTLNIHDDIAMQVDGEPWRQRGPSKVVITHLGAYPMLRPRRSL
jgi:diacylglycerol kinase (ATP)